MHPLPLLILGLGFCAHVVGDFVLQTEAIVRGKQSSDRILLWHVTQHVMAVAALVGLGALLVRGATGGRRELGVDVGDYAIAVCGVGVSHWIIDKIKILVDRRRGGSATTYVADQLAHVLVLGMVTWWIRARHPGWEAAELRPIVLGPLHAPLWRLAAAFLIIGGYAYAMRAGAIFGWMITLPVVRDVDAAALARAGVPAYPLRDAPSLRSGYLARFLGVTCVLTGALWALALLVTARLAWLVRRAGSPRAALLWTEYAALDLVSSLSTVLVVGVVVRMLLR